MNKKYTLISISIIFLWMLMVSIFYYIAVSTKENREKSLIAQANSNYKEIVNIRSWNAKMGGLYILSDTMEPNPYLKNNLLDYGKEKRFVKVNPAWMTRMLSESQSDDSYKYRLVSNFPINPVNKAVGFYSEALEELKESHTKKDREIYRVDEEKKQFQYLHSLYIKKECLQCHAEDGYKLGELRGGIAIELDARYYIDYLKTIWIKFYLVTAIFSILSIIVLLFIKRLSVKEKEAELLTKSLQGKIEAQDTKLKMAVEGAGLGYWNWNIKTGYHEVDKRWLEILGLDESDINHDESDWIDRIEPSDKKRADPIIEEAIKNRNSYSVEFRMRNKDGNYVWIQGSGAITKYDKNRNPLELSGVHQDISSRKKFEILNKENEMFLKSLYEKNPNIILVTDTTKIIQANDSFFSFFDQYTTLEQFSSENSCICHFFETSEFNDTITSGEGEWIDEVLRSSEPTVKITRKGKTHYFAVYVKKVFDHKHQNVMVTFSDITETYKLRHEFEELSIKDPLTGIYNRRYFNTIFPQEFNRAKRMNYTFSFAILDIDNFKLYNDNYGHDEGDKALKSVTRAIESSLKRSNEFFFRIGGEEFGIIFSTYTEEESLKYLQNLGNKIYDLQILHEQNKPYELLTISTGLCFVKNCTKIELNEIYKKADDALYSAKKSGRNRVTIIEA